jgi:hypothetical protein
VQNDDDIEGLTMIAPEKGGDLGSPVARIMAALYPRSVKALLLNYFAVAPAPKSILHALAPRTTRYSIPSAIGRFTQTLLSPFVSMSTFGLSLDELSGNERAKTFAYSGRGYSEIQGSRPSTLGHVVASSPVALLAWIGEKFLEWSDETPSMDTILSELTLYAIASSFPSTIYPYREVRHSHITNIL